MGLFDDLKAQQNTGSGLFSGIDSNVPQQPAQPAAVPERTWGEVATDTGAGIMQGFATLGGDLAWIGDKATGGAVDLGIQKAADRATEYWQNQKSDSLKQATQNLGNAEGFTGTLKAAWDNPEVVPDILASSLPYMLPTGIAGRVAGAAKGAKAATAATVGTGGLLEGANAGRETENKVLDMTAEKLSKVSPQYLQLIQNGMNHEDAAAQIANRAGLTAAAVSAPLAMLASKVTGAGKLEADFFTGQGLKGFFDTVLRESAEEMAQEASNPFGSNVGIKTQVNPDQSLAEGVPEGAALGLIAGAGQGAPMSALQNFVPPVKQPGAQGGIDSGLIQPTPTPDNPTPAPVERPDPSNGPISAAAAQMAPVQTAADLGVQFPEQQDWSQYERPTVQRQQEGQPARANDTVSQMVMQARQIGDADAEVRLESANRLYASIDTLMQQGNEEQARWNAYRADQIIREVSPRLPQIQEQAEGAQTAASTLPALITDDGVDLRDLAAQGQDRAIGTAAEEAAKNQLIRKTVDDQTFAIGKVNQRSEYYGKLADLAQSLPQGTQMVDTSTSEAWNVQTSESGITLTNDTTGQTATLQQDESGTWTRSGEGMPPSEFKLRGNLAPTEQAAETQGAEAAPQQAEMLPAQPKPQPVQKNMIERALDRLTSEGATGPEVNQQIAELERIQQGLARSGRTTEEALAYLDRQGRYDLVRAIDPDAIKLDSKGQPFASEEAAQKSQPFRQGKELAGVVPYGDGFAVRIDTAAQRQAELDAMRKKEEKSRKAKERYYRPIDPNRDDLLTAIALAGGIERKHAVEQGIDPAMLNIRGNHNAPVFTNKGDTADGMAQTLGQYGYINADSNREQDLLNKLMRAVNGGQRIMTPDGAILAAEEEAAKRAEMEAAEQQGEPVETVVSDYIVEARKAGVPEETIQSILDANQDDAVIAAVDLQHETQIRNTAQEVSVRSETGTEDGGREDGDIDFNGGETFTPEAAAEIFGEPEPLLTTYTEQDLQERAEQESNQQAQQDAEEQRFQENSADAFTLGTTPGAAGEQVQPAVSGGPSDMFGSSSNKPTQPEAQAQQVEPEPTQSTFRIEEAETSVRVYGDPAEIRKQLRAGGFMFKGAEIEGGLSFGRKQGDRIRSILGESVANEQTLTEQASDQPEAAQTEQVTQAAEETQAETPKQAVDPQANTDDRAEIIRNIADSILKSAESGRGPINQSAFKGGISGNLTVIKLPMKQTGRNIIFGIYDDIQLVAEGPAYNAFEKGGSKAAKSDAIDIQKAIELLVSEGRFPIAADVQSEPETAGQPVRQQAETEATEQPESQATDRNTVLEIFRQLGRDWPNVTDMAVAGNNDGAVFQRVRAALNKPKLTSEDLRAIASQDERKAAFEQGQQEASQPTSEQRAQQLAEEMTPEQIRSELDELSVAAKSRMDEAVAINGADALPAPIDYLTGIERERFNDLQQALPSQAQERTEARQRIEQRANERKAKREQAGSNTITANGITIEVPAIDQQLVDDYNRATHMGRGRDLNAELRSEAEGLLNELAERKYTMDTPEQKAEAKRLIESYLQAQAEFSQWDARYSANNPSWIVTGRSGRNMDRANRSNERHMDEYTKRVDRLQAQRDRIGDTLYKMRPQEVQENQALMADLRETTRMAGTILADIDSKVLAADTRKWASPKAHNLIERSLEADRRRTIEHIRELENTKAVQDAGGLVKVFGPRSKAGKLVTELLQAPPALQRRGFEPLGIESVVTAETQPEKGMPVEKVQALVDAFQKAYNGNVPLNFKVAATQEELYGKGATIEEYGVIKGSYHPASGEIRLAARNLSEMGDAVETLRHEVLGHYGLNTFTPADKRRILDQLIEARDSEGPLADTWAEIDELYADKSDDIRAEEVFAKVVESEPAKVGKLKAFVDRLLYNLNAAMRRAGIIKAPLKLNDVRRMARYVAEGIRSGRRQQQTFPTSDDALFRRGGPQSEPGAFAVPEETWTRTALRKMADKFQVLKDLQKNIQDAGGTVNESNDAYLAEELFHGKTEEDLRQMRETFIKPLADKMAKFGIEQKDLDQYLYAKHAPERNAHIAEINPELQEAGSGMSDAKAAEIIQQARGSGKLEQYEQLAGMVYDMLETRRETIRSAGLEEGGMIDAWESKYEFYVPLKGWAVDEKQDSMARTGSGFNIAGKESKRAMGRSTEAASPSSYAIQDLTETLIRRRKNEVGNALLNLVQDNPNKGYWQVFTNENPDMDRQIFRSETEASKQARAAAKKAGQPEPARQYQETVRETPIPMAMMSDKYFQTKRDGQTYFIKLEDERLMKAMKNIGPDTSNLLIRSLGAVNRVLSSLNTSYNPEFVVGNFARDVQTAVLNLMAEQSRDDGKAMGEKIAKQTVKDIPKAMKAVYRGLRNKDEAKGGEWQKWFTEFREAGAKTGWFDMKDIDGQAADLQALISMSKGGVKGTAMKWFKATGQMVEDLNGAVENAVRLSAYVNARKAGISQAKAASLAKNMTVNFNRRGEVGTTLNALYMFANASIQGSMNFARTMIGLKGQKGDPVWQRLNTAQKVAAGLVMGSYAIAMANRFGAGEDDDGENWYDKVPDYVKERNLVIMKSLLGGEQDGSYWTIPLPYGYNIFHVLGNALEGTTNGNTSIGKAATDLTLATLGSFSPIGFQESQSLTGTVVRNITPTIGKPLVDIGFNENFMGTSIYNENFPFGTPKPESQLGRRSTPEGYKAIAEFLNDVSGGSQWRSGYIDINPDVMRYVANYFTGAAGKFVFDKAPNNIYHLATLTPIEARETLFISRVSGRVLPYADREKFYVRRDEIGQAEAEWKGLTGGDRVRFYQANRETLKLRPLVKATERQLKLIRQQRDRIYAMDLPRSEQEARMEAVDARMKTVIDRFNREYRRATGAD